MSLAPSLQQFLEPWLLLLADDPVLRALQGGLLLLAVIVVFLVFFATRDILLRTRSLPAMMLSIILVAAFPIVGFFLYLLVRPVRTLSEKERDRRLEEILTALELEAKAKKHDMKKTK